MASSADARAADRAIEHAGTMTAGELSQAAYAALTSPYVTAGTARVLTSLAADAYARTMTS